jgi:hypothetical protein
MAYSTSSGTHAWHASGKEGGRSISDQRMSFGRGVGHAFSSPNLFFFFISPEGGFGIGVWETGGHMRIKILID